MRFTAFAAFDYFSSSNSECDVKVAMAAAMALLCVVAQYKEVKIFHRGTQSSYLVLITLKRPSLLPPPAKGGGAYKRGGLTRGGA